MKNIYLDIDGVLLANDVQPALHAEEFLEYLTANFPVFWLTTHCKGDEVHTQQHLARFFTNQKTLQALAKIKPTNWDTFKTEAIDFSKPFIWFDDDLFDGERDELERHNALSSWVEVDLAKDPHQLQKLTKNLGLK